ncbi:MAG TPA: hypothetical protein VFG04_24050 [Planctomycetaceae bacterium]|jgi:hypothetical protein|nr:hypothetical protein [Planctomycetaceae bacterium]
MKAMGTLAQRDWRTLGCALVGSALLAFVVPSGPTLAQAPVAGTVAAPKLAPIPESKRKPVAIATTQVSQGQKIVTATHSFNVYVLQERDSAPGTSPLARLAKEAGIEGQRKLALQMIGNSTVAQHWARGGGDNIVKKTLRGGGVDVLTLAPHRQMPEPAIDQFADLACQYNPNIRILAQVSWSAWDATTTNGTKPDGSRFRNEDHDTMTREDLNGRVSAAAENYTLRLRKQLAGINERYGRSIGYVVPVSQGVIQLRLAVLDGKVPGAAKQSDLFGDAMGHPSRKNSSLANLAEYIWFATMYGKSPVGLKTFVKEGDADSAKVQRLLQEIALDVVTREPMSGFPKNPSETPHPGVVTPSANSTPAVPQRASVLSTNASKTHP